MIFFAAMADERWMGSMKMLAASEPEMMENLDSDAMEKLNRGKRNQFQTCVFNESSAKHDATF